MSEESLFVGREAFHLLAGDLLGSGMSRRVYRCRVLPGRVLKVEDCPGCFQNVMEWQSWQSVRGTEYERWFAPCEWISACGGLLVMQETQPARKYPDRMPSFLTDFKRANYGELRGRFVCHDYGISLLMENGMTRRLRKAHWWDE